MIKYYFCDQKNKCHFEEKRPACGRVCSKWGGGASGSALQPQPSEKRPGAGTQLLADPREGPDAPWRAEG